MIDARSHAPDRPRPLAPAGAFTLLAVACLTIMVGCVIVPGLPSIGAALGVGRASGWLITLPSLGVVVFGPLAGRLIDRVGAYRALCCGLLLYGLLGGAVVLLHGPVAVFADRFVLGGATGLVMAGGTALISEFYAGEARLAMIARQGMAIELGGVIFLSIGGYLTTFGWAAPFALYGMAIVFLVMVIAFVPAGRARGADVDAVADGVAPASMAPVFLAALCSMVVFFTAVLVLPFRLSRAVGFSEAQVGYFLSCVSLVAVGFASIMPRVAGRWTERLTLVIAFGCYALAHLCFAFAPGLAVLALGALLLGAGFGLSIPLVNHMTIERSPAALRGRNLAYLSMAIFLGQFLASPIGLVSGGSAGSFLAASAIALVAMLYGLTPHAFGARRD